MDRIPSANLLPTLLTFLLLQGVLNVQTRSLVGSGNQVFQSKDDADIQNRILALLLHKNIIPDQEDIIGLELGSRIAELQELEALREELNLKRQLGSRAMDRTNSQPSKRGDACFWKYCV
ncbi:urotensin 2 domain containing [Colossoma macropomum]|uniref:urotensin 2 domain containing n=1 Tax=Colossoma macropomum TaxID=42526 RepID=UPI001863D929|nr:urotensin 2 domain containing [Colossoma macropomum]